jgi:hypothetical protein
MKTTIMLSLLFLTSQVSSVQVKGKHNIKHGRMSSILGQQSAFFNSKGQAITLLAENHAKVTLKHTSGHKTRMGAGLAQEYSSSKEDSCKYDEKDQRELCLRLINNHDMSYQGEFFVGTPP